MSGNRIRIKKLVAVLWAGILAAAFSPDVFGQNTCLSDDELKKMFDELNAPSAKISLNKKLRDDLVKMRAESVRLNQKLISNASVDAKSREEASKTRSKNETELCRIFQQHGWLTKDLVGGEGVSAALFLLKNSLPIQTQLRLFPVINLAVKKNEVEPSEDLAGLIDLLFLRTGRKQIFGTQAYAADGFLMLAPLQSEAKVDEWRKQYNLPPLNEYIRFLQNTYRMILIKSPALQVTASPNVEKPGEKNEAAAIFEDPDAQEEVIRVDSGLVNLSVSVFGKDLKTASGTLEAKDFKIYEDGCEQQISFFARNETPFDLVLVLDLSGSTADKIGLIRKSTQRFIEAKRPADRLAIVTFSSDARIVAPLTDDRAKLLESAKKIEGRGGSNIWDALKFTLDNVFEQKSSGRQRAVVLMTDGAETALMFYPGYGSKTLFADLLETVRNDNAVIVPIYLDTEDKDATSERIYRDARNTLGLLARESGGTFYKARKIEDLNGVYEQVLTDLSKNYSLGYVPDNEKRDGNWRTIKVELPNRPDLIVKTKSGYYAK